MFLFIVLFSFWQFLFSQFTKNVFVLVPNYYYCLNNSILKLIVEVFYWIGFLVVSKKIRLCGSFCDFFLCFVTTSKSYSVK